MTWAIKMMSSELLVSACGGLIQLILLRPPKVTVSSISMLAVKLNISFVSLLTGKMEMSSILLKAA